VIIPSGFSQVNLKFTGPDVPTGAEMTFGVDNQISSFAPGDVADLVANAVGVADLPDFWTTDVVLSSILVKNGPNATGPSAENVYDYPGTVTGDGDPPQTAFLIHKVTALGGRAGRGRMYQPGVPDAFVNGAGELTGTTAGILTAGYSIFRATLQSSDVGMVVLHGEGSPISTPTPVIGLGVDQRCATQRRRNRR
jgi:hypothetical protein